jgi:hypothetical protein
MNLTGRQTDDSCWRSIRATGDSRRRIDMFIVVHHTITDPDTAFMRGENLVDGNGAPSGVWVREFYPSRDKADVFCIWEGNSLKEVRDYVDAPVGRLEPERLLGGQRGHRSRSPGAGSESGVGAFASGSVPRGCSFPPGRARLHLGRMSTSRRMKRVEASHRYDVPGERGFAFITNTANWPRFSPGYVRLEDGSRWGASGDTARLVTRLFGRELTMTIRSFEPKRLVTYTSTPPGLPDAYHGHHFEPTVTDSSTGLSSRTSSVTGSPACSTPCWWRADRRAFERTFVALEHELVGIHSLR